MAKKPVELEGAPGHAELKRLCADARRVQALCHVLGFEFRGADRLIQHLEGHVGGGELVDVEPLEGHADAIQILEDPDLRPYLWDLEDD